MLIWCFARRCGIQLEPEGDVDERFTRVRDSFLNGFTAGREVGASVAVVVNDELVVDLWSGYRDRRKSHPWTKNTLCCMFSMTKAMSALCVLQAIADGLLDLDKTVDHYWPEFAVNGKSRTTVRHVLSHRAGLIGFHEPVDKDIYYDWTRVVQALAAEEPWWTPGEQHGYHARTFGYLLGELLLRVSGKNIGPWFAEHLAQPNSLDFFVGLEKSEIERCADMLPARVRPGEEKEWPPAMREMLNDYYDKDTPTGAAFQNPSFGAGYMNSEQFRRAEMPAMNGHGTARSVARLYSMIDRILPADLLREALTTHSVGPDVVLKSVTHFGLGFMLHHPDAPICIRPGSFGHAGAGGSMAFYDPAAKLGFCYVMNQMQEGVVTGGISATEVAEATYACL